MAHYTGFKELQNHVHRSGFDIGSKNVFSAKSGELLPVYWDLGLPNCTYDINLQYFTRTRPVQTAAYTRIREYFDFYAVPLDLIWKSFDSSVIQMGEVAPVQSKSIFEALTVKGDLPYCWLSDLSTALLYQAGNRATGSKPSFVSGFQNIFYYNRGDCSHKLLTYLNYGNVVTATSQVGNNNRWWNMQAPLSSDLQNTYTQRPLFNVAVNLFPLAAYQKIYQDFYRWSQWENSDPTSYNFDWYTGNGSLFGESLESTIDSSDAYWKRDNLFSLRYCNWNKDMFMGLLPNSQFGDIAVVDIPYSIPSLITRVSSTSESCDIVLNTNLSSSSSLVTLKPSPAPTGTIPVNSKLTTRPHNDLSSSFSILALRQAEALQKYREITQSVDTNYREQIKAHFGVNVPASDSHMAQYIGGVARNLDISEVVNNNLSDEKSEAVIYGKGVGTGTGGFRYSTGSKYCILMCIYHCVPLLDYDISGHDGQLLATSVEELPIPEFDNIGMEGVPAVQLFNSYLMRNTPSGDVTVDTILGYNPRYYNWKTKIDRVHGAFTTSLKDWVAPIDDNYLFGWLYQEHTAASISWPFFKVNPNTLDNIFAVKADSTWETDQFLINCNIDCKVVRPLSRDGVPY